MARWRRTFKIVGLIVASLIVLVVALWIGSNAYVSRQIESVLAAQKAQGYPVWLEDLMPHAVPDEQNAAVEYLRAFALLEKPTEQEADAMKELDADPLKWSDENAALMASYVARNEPALACVENAVSRPHSLFTYDPDRYDEQLRKRRYKMGELKWLLSYRSRLALRAGDCDRSIRDALLIWSLAKAFRERPTLLKSLVSNAILHTSCDTLRRAVVHGGCAGDLTSQHLAILQEEVLAERPRVFAGEFGDDVYAMDRVLQRYPRGRRTPPVRCIYWTYLRTLRATVRIACLPWPEQAREFGELEKWVQRRWSRLWAAAILPALRSGAESGVKVEAFARLARSGVALELYRNEHGQYPDSLEAVAPTVGPKNLEDPFGAVLKKDEQGYTQAPLIYRREGDSYVLYSIGMDMTDDGGRIPPGEREFGKKGDILWRGAPGQAEE